MRKRKHMQLEAVHTEVPPVDSSTSCRIDGAKMDTQCTKWYETYGPGETRQAASLSLTVV